MTLATLQPIAKVSGKDLDFQRGLSFLLSRPSIVTDDDVRRLPRLGGLSTHQLLAILPAPIDAERRRVSTRNRYWKRRDLVSWWRSRHDVARESEPEEALA